MEWTMQDMNKWVPWYFMQLLRGSPLESLYPSSYGEAVLNGSHSYAAAELPAAEPLRLHGHLQQPQVLVLPPVRQPHQSKCSPLHMHDDVQQ